MSSLLAILVAAAPLHLEAGTLTLEISSPETAQWFHIVDQLSGWSQFNHRQYRRRLATDGGFPADDEAALCAHAELRHRLGYGVLERAFYAPRTLEQALAWLGSEGKLSAADVEVERRVMKQFERRVVPFVRERAPLIDDYVERLKRAQPELEAFAAKADRFFGCGKSTLPAVLIASTPGSSGGGVNGGVLTVEVGEHDEVLGTLLHESWHALGQCKHGAMDEAAKRIGTPTETLSEGLAYAVSPGLWRSHGADVDALADKVAQDFAAKKHLDESYVRFNRLGLALRPTLRAALDTGGTFEQVLPIEVALFNALKELDAASEPTTPSIFCFGKPCTRQLIQRISQQKDTSIWGRELVGTQVSALVDRIQPRDTVLLFPEGEVPVEAQRLCGAGWAGLSQKLRAADAGFEQVTSSSAHVTVAWGAGALEHVAASLGLDGGL